MRLHCRQARQGAIYRFSRGIECDKPVRLAPLHCSPDVPAHPPYRPDRLIAWTFLTVNLPYPTFFSSLLSNAWAQIVAYGCARCKRMQEGAVPVSSYFISYFCRLVADVAQFGLVPGAGLEPAWESSRGILSPLRLPISPPGRDHSVN